MKASVCGAGKGLWAGGIMFLAGCLPYTNRTSYNTFTILPTAASAADTLQPIVAFNLQRELTSKVYPFVDYLGEKGDFAFSVLLYGAGAKRYRALVLNSLRIESGGQTHFAAADSGFIRFQSFRETDNMRYYRSDYVVALADTLKKPLLRVEYTLITHANVRERFSFVRRFYLDRTRGLGGY